MTVPATFALLFVLLLLGRLLRARGLDERAGADALNRLVIDVFFPAAILRHAPALTLDRDVLGLALLPWLSLAIAAGVALGARAALHLDRQMTAAVFLGTGFGNTAFMGYAVVPALLGEHSLRYAVVSDQLGSFVAVSTVGLFVIAAASGQARPTAAHMVKKVVTFPPFVAFVAGITVMPASLPGDISRALEIVAGALLPCMAIAIGLRLRFRLPAGQRAALVVVLLGKLVLVPLVVVTAGRALGLTDAVVDVALLQAAMPVMVTIGALLSLAGVVPELAAAMVASSTILSMVTLPMWYAVTR